MWWEAGGVVGCSWCCCLAVGDRWCGENTEEAWTPRRGVLRGGMGEWKGRWCGGRQVVWLAAGSVVVGR